MQVMKTVMMKKIMVDERKDVKEGRSLQKVLALVHVSKVRRQRAKNKDKKNKLLKNLRRMGCLARKSLYSILLS